MRHLNSLTRLPRPASTPNVCTNVSSDFQARLCFLFELLVNFFLPLAEVKTPTDTTTTT